MTAEPGTVRAPEHPLPALTTFELRDYRSALETALTAASEHAPDRGLLQDQLAAVIAEQESRITGRTGLG
jgi:hypothetical protein